MRIAILYPEGEYVEVGTVLIERNKTVTFSAGDGLVIRGGRWSRIDEGVIRLHSRDVYRSVEIVGQHLPNPFMDETCGLEGKSKEHLANSIHCKRLSFAPLRLSLDLTELRNDAQISYRWQVGQ